MLLYSPSLAQRPPLQFGRQGILQRFPLVGLHTTRAYLNRKI
jgi:hypothetical protein